MSSDRSRCTDSYGSASDTNDRRPDSAATSRPDSYTGPMSGCITVLKTDEPGTGSARSVGDATAERSDVSRPFEEMAQEREKRRRADLARSTEAKRATYKDTRSQIDNLAFSIIETYNITTGGTSWAKEGKDAWRKFRSDAATKESQDVNQMLHPRNQDTAASHMARKLTMLYYDKGKDISNMSTTRGDLIKMSVLNDIEQTAIDYLSLGFSKPKSIFVNGYQRGTEDSYVAICAKTQAETLQTLRDLDRRMRADLADQELAARLTANSRTSRASNSAMNQSSTRDTNSRPESTGFRSAAFSRLDSSLPSKPSFAPTNDPSGSKPPSDPSRPNTSLPPISSLAPTNDPSESEPPPESQEPNRFTQSTAFTVGGSLCAASVVAGTYLAYKWWKD